MQQKWARAEHLGLLAGQLGIAPQVNAGVVRVRGAPHSHDDHVAAPGLADLVEAGGLIGLLVKARAVGPFPPAVLSGVGRELQPPLSLVPVRTDLPAIPGTVHEWAPK